MKLIVAEKPSVAKCIASALGVTSRADGCFEGNGLIVSWCVGHLVSPMDAASYDPGYKKWRYDDLPILPEPFRYVLVKDKEDAFQNLKRLMDREDVTELVNACDAGREGELIFRLVYEMAGCQKPFSRLWISSMEDAAIREGFHDLRPGAEYDPLYQSALCRQKADWLIGINATRLFSVLYHRTLNVGRVQTPTLAMLVDRDWKITSFKKEKYHHVRLTLDGAEAVSEKISAPEEAEALRAACADGPAVCTSVTREQKKEAPPKLYDLTTLQREANRIFGYTAKQTLDFAQSLYEKKLLTYPRTDSRYLTADMAETASAVLHLAAKVPPFDRCKEFFPDVTLLVNDGKVSDHHAIIPTLELEKADLSGLPVGERNILLLVCRELLCAAAEPYVYEAVTATFECGGHTFTAKGRHVLSLGWKNIDRIFRASLKEKPEDEAEPDPLPDFIEGKTFDQMKAAVTEHFTTPPKAYTEDTLLSAMENAGKEDIPEDAERRGLGTPATRAAILEKLVAAGFVERKGKSLIPTKAGINLVTVLPDTLTSPMLTAEWEQKLTGIARGEADPASFMAGISEMAWELVKNYSHISEEGQKLFTPERETVGLCPCCGKPVYEGKKNFYCSDRSCQFVLWKDDRFWTSRKKELTRKMAADLLKKGRTSVKGMWSEKKGTTYDAVVVLDDTGGKYVRFKLEFPKRKEGVNGRYVVDEEAAAVVRQIFEWKRQEVSVYTIVERLKVGGVESPERHKRRAGTRNGDNIQGEGWCPSTIRGILQNRAYIGEMICGKSETALYKGLKKRITEKDKWVVVPDAHPPIVSVSDFEAVERQMQKDSSHRETAMEWSADIRAGMIDLFAGKAFCADCGKRMYYKRQRIQCKGVVFRGVYDCSTHMRRGHGTCFKHAMRQDVLNEKVFNAIRDQLQVALDYEKLLLAMRGGDREASVREKHKVAVASVKLRLNALKKKRAGLYESYAEGILNEEEYAFAKQTYEEQYEALNRLLDEAVERRERFLESISPDNKWLTMMRGVAGMTELTQEVVDAIIEKVLVYGEGRIEVVFNYNDVFYAMLECVEQIKEADGND